MATLPVERTTFEQILEAYLLQFVDSGGGTGGTILPTRLEIINAIKAKIDELIPEGEGVQFTLASVPNISNPYDIFINTILDEVAKELLLIAPLHVLVPTVPDPMLVGTQLTTDEWGKTGYVTLPDDFLRLQAFQMTEWERPVSVPITTLDSLYPMQKNKFVRGGVAKPVAVLAFLGAVKVLEYYSVQTAHTVLIFRYIPLLLPENIQSNLFDSLTWLGASKVLQIIGSPLSKAAYDQTILSFKDMQ